MVETGRAYSELQGVMVRGHCEIIEDPEAVRAVMEHGRSPSAAGPRASLDSAAKRVVLKITPRKISTWDHRKLGGRY